jgi:hypothetical protein
MSHGMSESHLVLRDHGGKQSDISYICTWSFKGINQFLGSPASQHHESTLKNAVHYALLQGRMNGCFKDTLSVVTWQEMS